MHRLAYSFGWDGSEVVPPGSSLIEIDLIEQPDERWCAPDLHRPAHAPSNAPAMRKAGAITSAGWPRLQPGAIRARTPGTAVPAGSDWFEQDSPLVGFQDDLRYSVPVPEEEQHAPTDDFSGALACSRSYRAASLDINYLRKTSALFSEFQAETPTPTPTAVKLDLARRRRRSAGQLPALFLADGAALSGGCLALPSSHARGPTMDC